MSWIALSPIDHGEKLAEVRIGTAYISDNIGNHVIHPFLPRGIHKTFATVCMGLRGIHCPFLERALQFVAAFRRVIEGPLAIPQRLLVFEKLIFRSARIQEVESIWIEIDSRAGDS